MGAYSPVLEKPCGYDTMSKHQPTKDYPMKHIFLSILALVGLSLAMLGATAAMAFPHSPGVSFNVSSASGASADFTGGSEVIGFGLAGTVAGQSTAQKTGASAWGNSSGGSTSAYSFGTSGFGSASGSFGFGSGAGSTFGGSTVNGSDASVSD
jgi:hypothetical protein